MIALAAPAPSTLGLENWRAQNQLCPEEYRVEQSQAQALGRPYASKSQWGAQVRSGGLQSCRERGSGAELVEEASACNTKSWPSGSGATCEQSCVPGLVGPWAPTERGREGSALPELKKW